MTCALISALSGIPVKNDVAMTGEITLRGKVLPIGGLKEKTLAAYTGNVKTVLIPRKNEKDLDEIDTEARQNLKFILCDTAEDILKNALLYMPERASSDKLAESSVSVSIPMPQKHAQISTRN
jgi:ATP-dependent Lon protease